VIRLLSSALLCAGCAGYQIEPYSEVQYRDERFTPEGGASTYSGETVMVGARYKAPARLDDYQLSRLEAALRDKPPPPPEVVVEAPTSTLGDLSDLGKDSDGNWTAWGAAVVIGLLLAGGTYLGGKRRGAAGSSG